MRENGHLESGLRIDHLSHNSYVCADAVAEVSNGYVGGCVRICEIWKNIKKNFEFDILGEQLLHASLVTARLFGRSLRYNCNIGLVKKFIARKSF